MNQLYLYLLLFVLFILQSCTLEPKGEHFVTVDPTPKMPNIQINLNFNTDTLYIPRQKSITFAYGMSSKEVIWSKLIINGKETSPMTYSQDTVRMTWTFLDNAGTIGPLEMQILYRSHTGSLGDKIGAEGVLFTKKWILKVLEYNQLASTITKTEFVDGTLKLDWTRFQGTEFTNYKIYKDVVYAPQQLQLVATITSRDQTTYLDNTYHGETSYYYILTNDEFQGQIKEVKGPVPTLTAITSQSGEFILKWTKPPFYKNLRGYRIASFDVKQGIVQLADVTNSLAESFTIPTLLFGEGKQYFLTLLPLTNSYLDETNAYSNISSFTYASYGFTSPSFTSAHAGLAPISYLLNFDYRPGVIVFDHQKMTTIKKITYGNGIFGFEVSANNKYLVGNSGIFQTIYFENLLDSTKSKMMVFKDLTQMSGNCSISDIGTGAIINGQNAIVYDFLNELKLAETKLEFYTASDIKISPSGNFFFCVRNGNYSEGYKYKDNQITKLPAGNLALDPLYYYDYLPGINEKMVLVKSNRIEVVDCNTWVTEHTWQFTNGFTEFYNLDKKSGNVLFREKNKLILFDVITGTRKELRDIAGDPNYRNSWTLFYNNGLLLGGNGSAIN